LNAVTGQFISTLSEESPSDLFQQSKLQKEVQLAKRLGTHKYSRTPSFLPGDSGTVYSLTFSPDGTKLAAGYASGEIKIWKVP
jgi:WD40 repeat protein